MIALLEGFIVILCVAGLCYFAAKQATLRLAKRTEQVDPCTGCGKELFACKTCDCVFDTEHEARRCADWDRIMKHTKHTNHHHDDDNDD